MLPTEKALALLKEHGPSEVWLAVTRSIVEAAVAKDGGQTNHWRSVIEALRTVAPKPGVDEATLDAMAKTSIRRHGEPGAWKLAMEGAQQADNVMKEVHHLRLADAIHLLDERRSGSDRK